MIAVFKIISATIAFLLELCMLFSLAYFGFHNGSNKLWKFILAIGLPLIAIGLWGYFAAPRSETRLQPSYRVIFELTLYLTTSYLLYKADKPAYAIALAGTAILSELAAWLLHQ